MELDSTHAPELSPLIPPAAGMLDPSKEIARLTYQMNHQLGVSTSVIFIEEDQLHIFGHSPVVRYLEKHGNEILDCDKKNRGKNGKREPLIADVVLLKKISTPKEECTKEELKSHLGYIVRSYQHLGKDAGKVKGKIDYTLPTPHFWPKDISWGSTYGINGNMSRTDVEKVLISAYKHFDKDKNENFLHISDNSFLGLRKTFEGSSVKISANAAPSAGTTFTSLGTIGVGNKNVQSTETCTSKETPATGSGTKGTFTAEAILDIDMPVSEPPPLSPEECAQVDSQMFEDCAEMVVTSEPPLNYEDCDFGTIAKETTESHLEVSKDLLWSPKRRRMQVGVEHTKKLSSDDSLADFEPPSFVVRSGLPKRKRRKVSVVKTLKSDNSPSDLQISSSSCGRDRVEVETGELEDESFSCLPTSSFERSLKSKDDGVIPEYGFEQIDWGVMRDSTSVTVKNVGQLWFRFRHASSPKVSIPTGVDEVKITFAKGEDVEQICHSIDEAYENCFKLENV